MGNGLKFRWTKYKVLNHDCFSKKKKKKKSNKQTNKKLMTMIHGHATHAQTHVYFS